MSERWDWDKDGMVPDMCGEWVPYGDMEQLTQEIERLREGIAEQRRNAIKYLTLRNDWDLRRIADGLAALEET